MAVIDWAKEAANIADTSGLFGDLERVLDTKKALKSVLTEKPIVQYDSDKPSKEDKIIVNGLEDADALANKIKELSTEQYHIFKVMESHTSLEFEFSSWEELIIHLDVRLFTIKRIIQLENAWKGQVNPIANYPIDIPGQDNFNLPADFWQYMPVPGSDGFVTIKNVKVDEAIESIMQVDSTTILDCNRMSVVIAYTALQDAVGKVNIRKLFAPQNWITLGEWHVKYKMFGKISLLSSNFFKAELLYEGTFSDSTIDLCIPGDVIYFRNDLSYKNMLNLLRNSHKTDEIMSDARYDLAWTGEYCICTAPDKFSGFGLREDNQIEFSSEEIRNKLLRKAVDLYDLLKEKAPVIWKEMLAQKIAKPIFDNVIIINPCYRVNTSAIIEKIGK